jgi:hypothetical protein
MIEHKPLYEQNYRDGIDNIRNVREGLGRSDRGMPVSMYL